MTLITEKGEKPESYRRIESAEEIGDLDGPLLAPLALADAAIAARPGARLGISVPNNTEIPVLAPYLATADLIAVEFPAFNDGRGFSLGRRLRRAGFTGALRASGPLIAAQFRDALACGFDEIELPETMANRQPVQQWMAAKDLVTQHYQSGYGEDRSILQMRLAARKG